MPDGSAHRQAISIAKHAASNVQAITCGMLPPRTLMPSPRTPQHSLRRPLLMTAMLLAVAGCAPESRTPPPPDRVAAKSAVSIPAPSATPVASPERYRVRFETSKGSFVVDVTRSLAPRGSDRFHELVTIDYFRGVRFFRMVPGFIAQFGIHGDPAVNDVWNEATIPDDPIRGQNTRGTMAFAASGPNTRATQLFVSTGDNVRKLDGQRLFMPFATVVEGMDVIESLNAEYGEEPNFSRIVRQGNAYLNKWYPALDSIVSATVVTDVR